MFITRHILGCISKAIKNNQKSVILPKKQIKNLQLLNIICQHGFIQGYEIRGYYIIIRLKQIYRNSLYIATDKSFEAIKTVNRKKNKCSISLRSWNKLVNLSGSTACYIISTDRGIFDSRSKINCGGFPLLNIL